MLPNLLKPKHTFDLIRLGQNNDGGYLIERKCVQKSKNLVSFGLGNDWSFEKDFKKFNPETTITCYDHTVNKDYWSVYLWHNLGRLIFLKISFKKFLNQIKKYLDYKKFFSEKNINHFERALGVGDLNNVINIIDATNNLDNVLLKIDVEGAEYRALDDIIKIQDRLAGLVIEFHNIDIHMVKILDFLKKFNLDIVHIHANNADFVYNKMPAMIEVTFSKNPKKIKDSPSIPHELDQICEPTRRDIELIFD
jgi:hypothetical protein